MKNTGLKGSTTVKSKSKLVTRKSKKKGNMTYISEKGICLQIQRMAEWDIQIQRMPQGAMNST